MAHGPLKLFAGSAHPALAREIAECLGIPPGAARLHRFPDSEVSFQIDEEAPEVQTADLPPGPGPDELEQDSWSSMFDRANVPVTDLPGRGRGWLRIRADLGDDPTLNACGLAYLSDDYPTDAVVALRPDRPDPTVDEDQHPFIAFSLDHAIWFHRPLRADQWHLFAMVSHGIISSRGLSIGHVFTQDGTHVATVSQEVLLRRRRPD